MSGVKISFIIGELSEEEVEALKNNQPVISKMILTPEDYKLFQYREGSCIQVETTNGNRLWCQITNLETLANKERVIMIFTLIKAAVNPT